jgi:hypothetical protein
VELVRSHLVLQLVLALAVLSLPATALAQPKTPVTDDPFPVDSEDADDPIGVDDSARNLDRVANERAAAQAKAATPAIDLRFGPEPPALAARSGEILTAAPAVREERHRVRVELEPGLARATVELTLTSSSEQPSEVAYRLALPKGAWIAALSVCNASGCRDAVLDDAPIGKSAYDAAVLGRAAKRTVSRAPLPVAHAALNDERSALSLRAAPARKGDPLIVRVRYEAEAAMHAGAVRFALPARGMDPRAAQTELTLQAHELLDARVAGQLVALTKSQQAEVLVSEPWSALPITAQARASAPAAAHVQRMSCDGAPCARARAWAGPAQPSPRDIILAVDASPSTEGPARGRLIAAVAAVLDAAPSGSRVRAMAFAARARSIIDEPIDPGLVALAPFAPHIEGEELGAATSFDAAWSLAESWLSDRSARSERKPRPLLVIVGDGGLSVRSGKRAFARAKHLGVEVSAINVGDRGAASELLSGVHLTGGTVIEAGAAADLATFGREREVLGDQVGALFAPTVGKLGGRPLRAGEALHYLGPEKSALTSSGARTRSTRGGALFRAKALVAADAQDIAHARSLDLGWPQPRVASGPKARCDRRGPAEVRSALGSDEAPVALAQERPCAVSKPMAKAQGQTEKPALGKGMPSDPLLDMLRLRVMPFARDCFRRDRGGRSEYELRAVFVFALAEREVVSADIEGRIPEPLRQCLMGAVDTLDVPRFTGTVVVRYPLVTESAPKAEQIQLTQVSARAVDDLLRED